MENKKEILFATPVIDGKLDDKYLESYSITEAPLVHLEFFPAGKEVAQKYMEKTCGTAYYLHDNEYLYVCTVVHDETICTQGREWRMNTEWPWDDDGAEIYLWFSDEDCMAIHSDAHGYRSVVDVHIWGDHASSRIYRDLPKEDWAATIDAENKNYTIEFRIPLPPYAKEGYEIGSLLEIDDRWAVGEGTERMIGALYGVPRVVSDKMYRVALGKKEN